MAMNLESVLRVTAKVTGLDELRNLEQGLAKAEKTADAAAKGFKKVAESKLFQAAAVSAAALAAAIGLSVKAAIDFEESMAGVRKVVSGLDSPAGLAEIRKEVFDLSKQMPITAKGFADIYAAAGQAGIPRQEIKEFAVSVGQIGVAFDMTAEEAGTAMAKLRTSLGLSQPKLIELADAMNHLSNNTASTAKQVTEFMLRAGTAGRSAGLSAEQTAAFGAAMIATGAESEVAATSFNNMVKALSRGASMTERQISALQRLGFVSQDAQAYEKQLTSAVEQESRKRIAAAEEETSKLRREIDRRYRDQLQAVTDGFDDQSSAFQEGLRDREEAQIKALQRQQDRDIEAARSRAEATGASADADIEAIRDYYDARIDVIRDNTQDETKARQRADRDRLQAIRDNLDDQKDAEMNAVKDRFETIKAQEEEQKKAAIEAAKQAAADVGKGAAESLAANLQRDAIGTITDVFNRIRQLPAEQRLSVVSDLFGDEARALLPLIENTNLLSQTLALVGDKSKYAGSSQAEYMNRVQTTAAQIQMANNAFTNLQITLGEKFVPALTTLIGLFTPVIDGFMWIVQNVPFAGEAIAILSGAFIGLVAVLPALASLMYMLAQLGGIAGILGSISGALGAIGPVIGIVVGALKGLGAVLLGVFSGPVGWVALLVAAGVAIYAFRDQIGAAFSAIGDMLKWVAAGFKSIFIDPVIGLVKGFYDYNVMVFNKLADVLAAPFKAVANIIRGIMNSILGGIEFAINGAIGAINNIIAGANRALAVVRAPQIPLVPGVQLPRFADGGMVTGPTVAMVGEGGEPEYIVPQSKAAGFAANWMAGKRGAGAIPRFAEGGVVTPSTANVSIQTGPVTQMNGTNYVTTQDLSRAVQAGVQQTLALLRNDLNTRRAVGIA